MTGEGQGLPTDRVAGITWEPGADDHDLFREERTFKGHGDSVRSVAFSPDGRYALSGSDDNTLKLWDVGSGNLVRTFKSHGSAVYSVAFSPDGRTALSGGWDWTLKLWDVGTGNLVRTFKGHGDTVRSVAFSPDGRYALSGSDDKTLKLWDMGSGNLVRTFKGHGSAVYEATDLRPSREDGLRTFKGHGSTVYSVAFSPDGRYALSGSDDKTLKLWDVESGNLLRTFKGHGDVFRSGIVNSVAFSPDGRTALSGSYDNTLKLWDVESGNLLRTFKGYGDTVRSVAFSPDGGYALSGSDDKTLKLWDVGSGNLVRTFKGHGDVFRSGTVNSVAFSPDGRYALSGSDDNTLKLWQLPVVNADKGLTGFELFSKLFADELRRLAEGSAGGKPVPPVLTQGKYEKTADFRERVARAKADYQSETDAYSRRLLRPAPAALRAEALKNALYSVFGEPAIAETQYDPDRGLFSCVVKPTGKRAGDFQLNLVLKEGVANDRAEAFDRDLKQGVPRIRFALDDSGRISFAQAEIEVSARAYAALPTKETLKRSLAQVRIDPADGGAAAGPVASLDIRYSAPQTLETLEPAADLSVDEPPSGRARRDEKSFALLIAIERYPGLPAVDFAERDAKTLQKYLVRSMGFPEENVIALTGLQATKSGIQKYLNEWLPKNTDAHSRLLVFYAGHGAPDPASGGGYLVPYDGDPNFLETTGLALKDFYAALSKLPAKEVIVAMDSCFSGAGGRSVLAKGARPLVTKVDSALPPSSKIVALTAASGSEISGSYEGGSHGLFTYFFLKGLRGAADKDGDGWVTVGEAYDYLKPNVQKIARRQNRDQTPQLLPGLEVLGPRADLKLSKVK
ncbi:MAG: caspase family protein [Nitrospirae bacterium]|nr:caspase family protein [Nitrospirota bacterium]